MIDLLFSAALKKTYNILTTIIVFVVVIFAVLLVGVRLLGVQVYSVISGSMVPEYPVGALIYVQKVTPSEVAVGDVITFVLSNEMPATHRVIGIDEENECFYTRGDANFDRTHYEQTGEKIYTEDPPVLFENLIGKPIFTIPLLGYVAHFVQHPPGMYFAIAIGALLLILVFLPDLLWDNAKKDKPHPAKGADTPEG